MILTPVITMSHRARADSGRLTQAQKVFGAIRQPCSDSRDRSKHPEPSPMLGLALAGHVVVGRACPVSASGQVELGEFAPGGDPGLGEDVAQVEGDGPRRDPALRRDVLVGQA